MLVDMVFVLHRLAVGETRHEPGGLKEETLEKKETRQRNSVFVHFVFVHQFFVLYQKVLLKPCGVPSLLESVSVLHT